MNVNYNFQIKKKQGLSGSGNSGNSGSMNHANVNVDGGLTEWDINDTFSIELDCDKCVLRVFKNNFNYLLNEYNISNVGFNPQNGEMPVESNLIYFPAICSNHCDCFKNEWDNYDVFKRSQVVVEYF